MVLILQIIFYFNPDLTPLPSSLIIKFLIGAVIIIFGLSIFLLGIDISIAHLGHHVGVSLSKSNKIWVVVGIGLIVGFFISVAEPDLQILAGQVSEVTNAQLTKVSVVTAVSIGIAVMLVMGFIRIVYNFKIHIAFTIVYGVILLIAVFVDPLFLAVSFDASGATTGALTVPFILNLAVGVANLKKDSQSSEKDSFGLVGITSTGAILGILIMGIIKKSVVIEGAIPQSAPTSFLHEMSDAFIDSFIALAPLIIIFLAFQFKSFRFNARTVRRTLKGFVYTFVGLSLFLTGVNAGFMNVGTELGRSIASLDNNLFVVAVGFALGLVTILAEPAVYVLNQQIETVTSGSIKRSVILLALALGVGSAVALSMIKIIVPGIQLWHILLPGFGISVLMSFFVPELFVGIAFDSGGVASGPMTATFILAFSQGVADIASAGDVLQDAFGMIALVAMTPIITLQAVGLIYKIKTLRKRRETDDGF